MASRSSLRTTSGLLSTSLSLTGRKKRAAIERGALMVTAQGAAPGHSGTDHPAKTIPGSGSAERITIVPGSNGDAQAAPQSIPPMLDLTVPWPLPVSVTTSGYCVTLASVASGPFGPSDAL